jgi:RNA polymerase sigma-70 factor (ECF subfamily)
VSDNREPADPLDALIARHIAGDPAAAEALIEHSLGRLRRLARKMLGDSPRVRRWEETDDVFQNAAVRLFRALQAVRPASARDFIGLATAQIRRELIDLARHHYGPEGQAAHHASDPGLPAESGPCRPMADAADGGTGPVTQLQWQEFHTQVQALPQEEREVFDLIFYQGLSQEAAVNLLGIALRTVRRRWRSAKLLLHKATRLDLPGE